MSIGSLTASFTTASTSVTALFGRPAEAGEGPPDRLKDAEKEARRSLKLIDKLDRALDGLRGEKRGRPFTGYDRTGRFERPEREEPASLSARSAEISQTEISIGPEGISYSQTSLSYASLQTAGGSLTTASLSVTKAYLSFGGSAVGTTSDATA